MILIRPNTIAARVIIASFLALLAGCKTAMLYPVSGPLASQVPLPVVKARIKGVSGNSGSTSMTLADGEKCKGRWSSIAPTEGEYVSVRLSSTWDTVYGVGYSQRNVGGVNRGEAMLTCDRGTVMEVEFLTGSGTANGVGVAKDNHGNVYKVLF